MTEQTQPKKTSVSYTRLHSYARCGEAYRRRYIENEKIPPGIAQLRGVAFHVGAEINFKQKIETHKDLTVNEVMMATAAAFDGEIKAKGVMLTEEEEATGKKKVLGAMKDRTVNLARNFTKLVAPEYQPAQVETMTPIALNAETDLVVKIDLIDDKDRVVDLKTTSRPKRQQDIDSDLQFDIYGLGFRAMKGKDPAALTQEILLDGDKNKRQTLSTTRTIQDYEQAVHRINAFLAGTKAGVFMPTNPGNWWCSKTWCGYYRTCPYVKNTR